VISDLAELRAQVVNMAEADTQNGLEVMKRMDRFESSFKQTHKTLRQEVTAEISGVKEKHSTLVGQVSDLAHALSLVEAAQASMRGCMDARHEVYQEMETRVKAMEREAGVVKKTHDPSEAAFFIAGLNGLREAAGKNLPRNADPVFVIRHLLQYVHMEQHLQRIQLLNVQSSEAGRTARSAVVYMSAPYHKGEAVVRIKSVLARYRMAKVLIEDCFPLSTMEDVRLLKQYGQEQKHKGQVAKFRVINRGGVPVLQAGETHLGRYLDLTPPASYRMEVMEAEGGEQRPATGGEGSRRSSRPHRRQQGTGGAPACPQSGGWQGDGSGCSSSGGGEAAGRPGPPTADHKRGEAPRTRPPRGKEARTRQLEEDTGGSEEWQQGGSCHRPPPAADSGAAEAERQRNLQEACRHAAPLLSNFYIHQQTLQSTTIATFIHIFTTYLCLDAFSQFYFSFFSHYHNH
jgi:hypothetical protein